MVENNLHSCRIFEFFILTIITFNKNFKYLKIILRK